MNTLKTTFLLTALTLLLLFFGKALGGNSGMMFALVMAGVMNFVSYWFSDKIVLKGGHGGRGSEALWNNKAACNKG